VNLDFPAAHSAAARSDRHRVPATQTVGFERPNDRGLAQARFQGCLGDRRTGETQLDCLAPALIERCYGDLAARLRHS
jgi:hypothetical protein